MHVRRRDTQNRKCTHNLHYNTINASICKHVLVGMANRSETVYTVQKMPKQSDNNTSEQVEINPKWKVAKAHWTLASQPGWYMWPHGSLPKTRNIISLPAKPIGRQTRQLTHSGVHSHPSFLAQLTKVNQLITQWQLIKPIEGNTAPWILLLPENKMERNSRMRTKIK